jgi:hypothetical protein
MGTTTSVKKCEECGRYLDELTDDAVAHPIYTRHCIACGTAAVTEDGGWTMKDQYRREDSMGINPSRKGRGAP